MSTANTEGLWLTEYGLSLLERHKRIKESAPPEPPADDPNDWIDPDDSVERLTGPIRIVVAEPEPETPPEPEPQPPQNDERLAVYRARLAIAEASMGEAGSTTAMPWVTESGADRQQREQLEELGGWTGG